MFRLVTRLANSITTESSKMQIFKKHKVTCGYIHLNKKFPIKKYNKKNTQYRNVRPQSRMILVAFKMTHFVIPEKLLRARGCFTNRKLAFARDLSPLDSIQTLNTQGVHTY